MSHNGGDAKDRQVNDSHQSVWMAHWMRTSSNSSSTGNSCFTLHDGCEEGDCNTKNGVLHVQSKDTRKVMKLDLVVRPSNMQSFPMFCFNQNIGSEVTPPKELSVCDTYVSKTQAINNFPSRLCKQSSVAVRSLLVADMGTDNQLTAKIFGSSYSRRDEALDKHPSNNISVDETGKKMLQSFSGTGSLASPPKFSQMSHHLLITKKVDVNLSKGKNIIGEPRLSTDFKGNAFNELLMWPPSSNRVSTSTEGKHAGDVETVFVGSKDKLSAQTKTIDIDVCDTKELHQGMASSISNKDFIAGETSIAAQATSSLPKVGSRTETEIPDSNQEPTECLAAQCSTGKRDLITSRTENLVKRLKLTAPDSPSHARKSSRIEDGSSSKKTDQLFTRIMNYNRNGSEPRLMKRLGERQLNFEKSVVLFKNWESSCMDSVKKQGDDQSLAQRWIRRWCRNQGAVPWMKQAAPVVCEPENFKAASKKQLPSIAAMALMGKATNRFRPCEFRKTGPVIVWNTEKLSKQS